jgi:hypothetical protein
VVLGFVIGRVSDRRYIDDDVGAAFSLIGIPVLAFFASIGFLFTLWHLATPAWTSFPLKMRLIAVVGGAIGSLVVAIPTGLALSVIETLSKSLFLGIPVILVRLALPFVAGALGCVLFARLLMGRG